MGFNSGFKGLTEYSMYKDKYSTILLIEDNVIYITEHLQMQHHPLPVKTETQQGKALNV